MKIIPYARQWIDDADIKAVADCLKSDFLTQGPRVEAFERLVSEYCGAKYAVAVNSGTSALHIACVAAGLKKGDQAVTSAISFVASANCILYCEAMPVFADIDFNTICIDYYDLKKKISAKTKIIIPVHFAGHSCEMEKISFLAKRKKIIVIEDGAHALGAQYRGYKVGSCRYSDMTILSFHAIKHITTGEGGMILTNNVELYHKLRLLRSHGITKESRFMKNRIDSWYYEMQELGFNYRITDLQCALGISQFSKLEGFIKRRREIALQYTKNLSVIEELKLPIERKQIYSPYHIYVVRFNLAKLSCSRREIFEEYRKRGILVNVHYIPIYFHPFYQKMGYKTGICPNAEKHYATAITLPLYPKMSDREVKRVIEITKIIIHKFKNKNTNK